MRRNLKLSVPVLEIIFLSCELLEGDRKNLLNAFPSPHWGLFFYHRKTFKETWAVAVAVSVPVLGIIFYLSNMVKDEKNGYSFKFPSPYWGLFFITLTDFTVHNEMSNCFRPRTGDYFFIGGNETKDTITGKSNVSVPILGIMFLSIVLIVYSSMNRGILCFRPRIRDFFIKDLMSLTNEQIKKLPSP